MFGRREKQPAPATPWGNGIRLNQDIHSSKPKTKSQEQKPIKLK
jgi:hypothetical protein